MQFDNIIPYQYHNTKSNNTITTTSNNTCAVQ